MRMVAADKPAYKPVLGIVGGTIPGMPWPEYREAFKATVKGVDYDLRKHVEMVARQVVAEGFKGDVVSMRKLFWNFSDKRTLSFEDNAWCDLLAAIAAWLYGGSYDYLDFTGDTVPETLTTTRKKAWKST